MEEMLSASVQSSQLLQQLVSQQTPKGRSWNSSVGVQRNAEVLDDARRRPHGIDEEGGVSRRRTRAEEDDSGGGPKAPRQQSNSVLMNLLVSGCDVSAGYVCLAKPRPSKGIASK